MGRFNSGPFGSNGAFSNSRPLDYRAGINEVTQGQFFNAVYAWMAAGLALTAVVAWWVALYAPGMLNMGTFFVLFLVQIGLVMAISGAINRIGATAATAMFLLYAALNGASLSVLFMVYTKASLGSTFLVTAGTFGAMSLYGYTTKRDLTRLGSLLFMALIGFVIASIVNIFLHSSMLHWIITYAGVAIFVGLTAYDTQRLKEVAAQTGNNPALANRMAVVGSLILYLDFVNLFILLLQLLGDRRR